MIHFIFVRKKVPLINMSTQQQTQLYLLGSQPLSHYLQVVDKRELENELMCTGELVNSAKMVTDELFSLTQKTFRNDQKQRKESSSLF